MIEEYIGLYDDVEHYHRTAIKAVTVAGQIFFNEQTNLDRKAVNDKQLIGVAFSGFVDTFTLSDQRMPLNTVIDASTFAVGNPTVFFHSVPNYNTTDSLDAGWGKGELPAIIFPIEVGWNDIGGLPFLLDPLIAYMTIALHVTARHSQYTLGANVRCFFRFSLFWKNIKKKII